MEYEKDFDEGASLMMMANFRAVSESTGYMYDGFSLCSAEWSYQQETYLPCYEDMIEHFYCHPEKYGYNLGPLHITYTKYEIVHPKDNLLMNMN